MEFWSMLFSLEGRAKRRAYFLYSIASDVLIFMIFMCRELLIASSQSNLNVLCGHALGVAGTIISLWINFVLTAKRLRDMGVRHENLLWVMPALLIWTLPFERGNPWHIVVFCVALVINLWLLFTPTANGVDRTRPMSASRI